MSEVINTKDWCNTPIGCQDAWPQFLISNIYTVLFSNSPVFLLWGAQNFCFYNDSFYKSFGAVIEPKEKLGAPAADCLLQLWPIINPIVIQVLKHGDIITSPPKKIALLINGIAAITTISFTVIPMDSSARTHGGVLVCCTEIDLNNNPTLPINNTHQQNFPLTIVPTALATTNRILTHFEVRFLQLASSREGGHLLLRGADFIIEMANAAYLKIINKTSADIIGKAFFTLLPQANQVLQTALTIILQTGATHTLIEQPFVTDTAGIIKTRYLNYTYQPCMDSGGEICGITCIVDDVTASVDTKFAIIEKDKQFKQLLMQSPLAIVIFRGPDFIIDTVNNQMLTKFWHKAETEVVGQPFLDIFPELRQQKYPALLARIFKTGKNYHDSETKIELNTATGKNTFYVDATYSPLFDLDGGVSGIMVTASDVTLTVKTRALLQLKETQLQITTTASRQATYELDFTNDTLTHCENLAKIYGLPSFIKLTHQEIYAFFHPDDSIEVVEKAYIASQITGVLVFDARIIWPDKSVHWIRTQSRMMYTSANVLYKMAGTVMDITIEKEKDEYIMKLAAIVESSIDAIVGTRLDGSISTWNDAAVNLFGYTALEMIGKPHRSLFDAEHNPLKDFIANDNANQKFCFETTFVKKDASVIDISCTVSPIKNCSGQIIGTSKIVRDITKQKIIQNAIISSESRFRLLAEAMTQLIWTSNGDGVPDYFNTAIQRFTGVSNEDILKMGWLQFVHPEERENNLKKWIAVVEAGLDFSIEHRLLKHDGEYIWHLTRAVPQRDANNKVISWVGTCTDIHEIKKNDQNRDFFISMASHELNTPVTTIKGYVEILIEEYGSKGDQFFNSSIANVHKQIKVLMALITDLLDLSKIKAGVVDLYKEHFYSLDFITENLNNLSAIHPDYTLDFVEKEQVLLFADRGKMDRVLLNILTNAIKYSPHNKVIKIYCKVAGDQVIFSVQDFGIGISKINQQKIFQRFFRISGKSEKTYPGFGIGLFIAAEIIEKHQGEIGLESTPGEGSVFNFSIPITKIFS